MQFKDITPGHAIYILDKQAMTLAHCKVREAGRPYLEPVQQSLGGINRTAKMVRDLTVDDNGRITSYTIPEDLSIAYSGNLILATDTTWILGELKAFKAEQEEILASVDRRKAALDKATALMADLDPSVKEKQETDKRLGNMEEAIKEMAGMIQGFIDSYKTQTTR